MVIDLFYIYDELSMLEIRLNILDPVVDKFIIVEATESFSGNPKPLCYEANKERFAKWSHKIKYYVVDDFPMDEKIYDEAQSNSNTGNKEHWWVREFYQKESARKALKGLKDTDIVFVSDIDEIWNPDKVKELTDFSAFDVIRPKQKAIYYYLNNRCSEENGWTGTIVTTYGHIKKNVLENLRTRHKTPTREIENGGWHFGFIVGLDGHENKMKVRNHPEYKLWEDNFMDMVKSGKDYRGRGYTYWKDDECLPQYLKDNKTKWQKLFL
jgi:beta-1,4-mannosyl-glycoprotein beta-1,4-N-acetylglucosaminyltransferase